MTKRYVKYFNKRYNCWLWRSTDIEKDPWKEPSRIINKETRYKILKRQNWNCNNCGCKLIYSEDSNFEGNIAHIDHIHPFSKRDSYINGIYSINELSNLQALCKNCNLSKGRNIG